MLIQGMTGKEGSRMAGWMITSGTKVVAGVTPGKGGQEVEGRPIFNTVKEARAAFPDISVSCVVVPAALVLGAVREAMEAGIPFIHILTENVPVHDAVEIRHLAVSHQARVLGPASVGLLRFPAFRLSYLGGETPFDGHLKEGDIAALSTSGGMTNEIISAFSREGLGIRIAIAVGGGSVVGTSLVEAMELVDADPDVKRIAIFVEPGQPILNHLLAGHLSKKPLTIFLAGEALDRLPRGLPYGHTGTILGENEPTIAEMRAKLKAKGIACASTMSEFIQLTK